MPPRRIAPAFVLLASLMLCAGVSTGYAQTAPSNADSCSALTDKAGSADLKAATAQSQRQDLPELVRLYEDAASLWTQASDQCQGRAQSRARRNLQDNEKILTTLREQMGSGPLCAASHKDAAALQDLARSALGERRWSEASVLFRKAENMWDLAAERCTGGQQDTANRRREQSEIDGHNAEHCAPLFEKAREHTQKTRASASTASREARLEGLTQAETLWRDALTQCRGPVLDAVRNNIQTVTKERGTPWTGQAVQAKSSPAALGSSPIASSPSSLAPATVGTRPATPAIAAAPPAAPEAMPPEFSAGTTRFIGSFVRDPDSPTYSGNGKVMWAHGDVYEGRLVKGLRHGKGLFIWANGQRYNGDWVQDKPTGKAQLYFASGNAYEGQVIEGIPQGQGSMRYASGDSYTGQFAKGEPQGQGTYQWKNQQAFEGTWNLGKPNGQGKLKFANGDVYEGPMVNGVIQGLGSMVFADGSRYTGTLANGLPHGTGSFVWPNGDQYTGEWQSGKKHGKGVFNWKSGERWEGRYELDNQAEGEASVTKN